MRATQNNRQIDYKQLCEDYRRIEKAIRYLEDHYREQPALQEIAANAGLSEYHFQRLFTRWVGISPKRFLQFLTKEHAKSLLQESTNLLEVTYRTGLSGPGRLHDLFVSCEAVTPGEYKKRGQDLTIDYGIHPSPFGECLLAITERGICGLYFVSGGEKLGALDTLRSRWSRANLRENPAVTASLVEKIFPLGQRGSTSPLPLLLHGTNFQIKVWEALIRIPPGRLTTYGDIATYIGAPDAARAVGQAVASNPIAVIIPCHRVIRKMGQFGGYRWGTARKKAILGWEMAQGVLID